MGPSNLHAYNESTESTLYETKKNRWLSEFDHPAHTYIDGRSLAASNPNVALLDVLGAWLPWAHFPSSGRSSTSRSGDSIDDILDETVGGFSWLTVRCA